MLLAIVFICQTSLERGINGYNRVNRVKPPPDYYSLYSRLQGEAHST